MRKTFYSLSLIAVILLSVIVVLSSCSDDKIDITVSYDDRYTFDQDIVSVDDEEINSYITGSADKDVKILTFKEGSQKDVVITGCGTVTAKFADGSKKRIKSEPAKINLLLLLGQSNSEGSDGDTEYILECEKGKIYSTYAPAYTQAVTSQNLSENLFEKCLIDENGARFVASSLTSNKNVLGEELEYSLDSLSEKGKGKGGMDSSIARQWNYETGEKVWVVNASHSGSSIKLWDPDYDDSEWISGHPSEEANNASSQRNQYREMKSVMDNVVKTMKAEIDAGHYTLNHYGFFWLQGEADSSGDTPDYDMPAETYTQYFTKLFDSLKRDFKIGDKEMEFASIIMVRTFRFHNSSGGMSLRPYSRDDISYTGTRISQYYMGLNTTEKYKDIYIVSNAGDRWVEQDSYVLNYFAEMYGDAFKDMFGYDMPETMADVHHNGPHYTQKGFNELGVDAVRNLLSFKKWYTVDEDPAYAIDNYIGQSIPSINNLYKNGEYSDMSLSDFENEFRKKYYNTEE